MKKLVIFSKLFLFRKNNDLIKNNLKLVDLMESQEIQLLILVKSELIEDLKSKLPKEYKNRIVFVGRCSSYKQRIRDIKHEGAIIALVGVVNEDAIFAFNCKIPLFNPQHIVDSTDISDKVKEYGLPFWEFTDIGKCLKAFENYNSYYFGLSVSEKYRVFSLFNANTYYQPEEEVKIKKIFHANLKGSEGSRDQKILMILLFMLMAEVTRNQLYQEIDYWGTFPSSKTNNTNTAASFIKEAARCILGKGPKLGREIFIRHTDMISKQKSGSLRLENKCNKDFDTLIINPKIAHLIKGKSVCIIDDYITNGYSAESAKHLLLNHGVKNVIVLSIGKFGTNYYSTNYDLQGNLTKPNYQYSFINEKSEGKRDSLNQSIYNVNNIDLLSYGILVFNEGE